MIENDYERLLLEIKKDLCDNSSDLVFFVDCEHKPAIRSMIFMGELVLNITWKVDLTGSGEDFFNHVQ